MPGTQGQVCAWAVLPPQYEPAAHSVHVQPLVDDALTTAEAVPGAQVQGAGWAAPPAQKEPGVQVPQAQAARLPADVLPA